MAGTLSSVELGLSPGLAGGRQKVSKTLRAKSPAWFSWETAGCFPALLEHSFSLEIPDPPLRGEGTEVVALVVPWWIREDPWRGREESRAKWSSLPMTQFSAILGILEGCCSREKKSWKAKEVQRKWTSGGL